MLVCKTTSFSKNRCCPTHRRIPPPRMICNDKHLKADSCKPSPTLLDTIILRPFPTFVSPLRAEGGITPIAISRRPITLQGVQGKKARSVRLLIMLVFPCSAFVYCTIRNYTTVCLDGMIFLLYSSPAVSHSSMLSVCSSTSMRRSAGWILDSMVLARHLRRGRRRLCIKSPLEPCILPC